MAAIVKNMKVSGSTLIEVLVAMIILMVVFSIAFGIYSKIVWSGVSSSQIVASREMRKMIRETKDQKSYVEETTIMDSIMYHKLVYPYSGFEGLLVVELKAELRGKELGCLRQIIYRDYEEN